MGPESLLGVRQSREQQVGLSHVRPFLAGRRLRFVQRVGTHEEGNIDGLDGRDCFRVRLAASL